MSSSAVSTPTVSTSSERLTGRVKWFNNKSGYGFITVTDGNKLGSDVFVHHSSIKVDSEQYKYLVQGEYVDFNLLDTKTNNHEFQAGEVCGIKGGKLMCETRRDSRVSRYQYRSVIDDDNENSEPVKMSRTVSTNINQRTMSPRGHREEGIEWSYVSKNRNVSESGPVQSSSQSQRVSGGRGRGQGRGQGQGQGRGRPSKSAGRGEGTL